MPDCGNLKFIGGVVLVLFLIFAILFGFSAGAFLSPEDAIRAARTNGFSDAVVLDHAWFMVGVRGCDEKDQARFTVSATNPSGDRVTFYVCEAWFKGGTIRVK